MADYIVAQYSSNVFDNGNGYNNIYVTCNLLNSGGNVKTHHYRICTDIRWPDMNILKSILDNGFEYAKNLGIKISISAFSERMYLWISLPNDKGKKIRYQFTGKKMTAPYYSN